MNQTILKTICVLICTLLSALMPFLGYCSETLVKVEAVKPWHTGIENLLNCEITVPFPLTISSEVDAKLDFILPEGSKAKQGEVIALQNGTYLKYQLQQLQTQQEVEKRTLAYAQTEFERLSQLGREHVSESQLNQLAQQRDTAELNHEKLVLQIQELRTRLSALSHHAPSDGHITQVQTTPGQFVANGQSILMFVADPSKELKCELPNWLAQNQEALANNTFLLKDATPLTLTRTSASLDSASQVLALFFKNEGDTLSKYPLNQRVQITMRSSADNLFVLPAQTVVLAQSQNYVWQLDSQSKVRKQSVEIIKNLSNSFLVKSSLKAGDHVVSLGQQTLTENMSVTPLLGSSKEQTEKVTYD